jgi:hypothetical protein
MESRSTPQLPRSPPLLSHCDTSSYYPLSAILLQGYLRKHTGGIFFATKKRWAALTSDGYLSLSKKHSQLPYNRIQLLDFTNFNSAEDSQSLTFDSVEDGVLVVSLFIS